MFAARLDGGTCGEKSQAIAIDSIGRYQLWFAFGKRTSLVEGGSCNLAHGFENGTTLHQQTTSCPGR